MGFREGFIKFVACVIIAAIVELIIAVVMGHAVFPLIHVMDVPAGSTFDNFPIIQQLSWLVGWIPVLIVAGGGILCLWDTFDTGSTTGYYK